jgi:hypothetical protein
MCSPTILTADVFCSYVDLRVTPALRNVALFESRGGQVFFVLVSFSLCRSSDFTF